MQDADEKELNLRAHKIPEGDITAAAYLYRVLTLCGLGISVTGISNHGSMGEHQISHYIDCFAGGRHPKTLHGQQVGVASLSMARLQQKMLARDTPPKIHPTRIDFASMERRMGKAAEQCLNELRLKAFDEAKAEAVNLKLQELWPLLKKEVEPFMIPADEMTRLLKAAGGPATAAELGVPSDFYREAILHCREMRNRFSFLDIAADADDQEAFAAALG
jgi:glycerol-1-phosphate dehydrogenase [NAD(P)+]